MTKTAIWLSEQDVTSLISLDDAITALEAGLRSQGKGEGLNIPKALAAYGDGSSMHSLGSALPTLGYGGYKNWVHTKRGAKAVFVLFDAVEGRLLAMMEANSLGQLRTSAMTGLGTKWVAREGANDMAIIGSGRQAMAQVAAVNAVRKLARIRVWSPTPEKRQAFAAQLRDKFSAEVVEAQSIEAATEGATIVTVVTRAQDAFLKSSMLPTGVHLNAVGAILPANAELHQDVVARAGFIAVDDVAGVQKASRELIDFFEKGEGKGQWNRVHSLGKMIADGDRPPAGTDLTMFKSMGMGISDLSVAMLAYERARKADIGKSMPLMDASPLRF
ncbi:Alanine dehydrogenase [compost metagenome]|uniref:Ornithine cyclodeaminase family protein n=1 Tax=Polaromonas aquatica TaxID=332657 RepID=A0ABW1TRY8_9BURK